MQKFSRAIRYRLQNLSGLRHLPYIWRFQLKTLLYRWMPGGYGYYRRLRQYQDRGYVHERDKHPVRHKHHGQGGWKETKESATHYRDYTDYEEYVTHQKQKFDEMIKMSGGFDNRTVATFRIRFYNRFKHLLNLLPKNAVIVCAGARQGTEVEVLRDLGFYNAYGIDLNPGPANPFVRVGDFMHMDNADDSVDLVYTNCVDHAFNLADFFAEHARVIKPKGYVIYDLNMGQEGGPFEAVEWDSEEEIFLMMLRHFKHVVRVERSTGWQWVLLQGVTKP